MYDEDAAVAKLDGYVISVAGAAAADRREAPGADREGRALGRLGDAGRAARSSTPVDAVTPPSERRRLDAKRRGSRRRGVAAGADAGAGEDAVGPQAAGEPTFRAAGRRAAGSGLALHCRPALPGRPFSVMYAIVKVGGKQYRVEKGDTLLVDRMPDDEGAKVDARAAAVPLGDDDRSSTAPTWARSRSRPSVTGHERGKKIHVLKFKPKRGYKRRNGHRSDLTRLEIEDIKLLARKPAAAEAETRRPSRSRAEGRAREGRGDQPAKKAPAKKPAAKKPAAKKAGCRGEEACRQEAGGEEAGRQEAGGQEGGRRWLIRRGSAPAATAATPTPSASA